MANSLRIEQWKIGKVLPYAKNAREHPPEQVRQIAASIREFGFNQPVLVDDAGVLVAGHGRILAAQSLQMTTVPVIRLGHLTGMQAQAYRIADNRIALSAKWDEDLLARELSALTEADFNLDLLGFDGSELDRLLNPDDEDDERQDAVPDAPAVPVSRLGDVWILGDHRIRCGSSTSAEDVAALLAGARPHLMVTDPPYGVNYDPEWRKKAGVSNSGRMGVVENDDRADWREAWALFPGDTAYVWHAALHAGTVAESLVAEGFLLRAQVIWSKSQFVLGRGDYHWGHEPCWYGVRKGAKSHWQGARDQSTLWQIRNASGEDDATVHSTQKPVECMRRPIINSSTRGDGVYEPFSGSGSTIIACETSARRCYAMELSPAYVDVAVMRWQAYTGRAAVLEGGGRFDEEAAARGAPAAA